MNESKKVAKKPEKAKKAVVAPKRYHANDARNKARNIARDAHMKAIAAEKKLYRVAHSHNAHLILQANLVAKATAAYNAAMVNAMHKNGEVAS